MAKFIFVTGGVVSGIGKGISAASVGRLLKDNGFSVFMQKFDPYLNVDPGTMSPYQHGEVFVTKDGGETDLDLGHYERFIDEELTKDSSITSGRVYNTVIEKERRGDYEGKTVQVIPHVTDEIKEKVYKVAEESKADFIITEIGGTIGDIESQPFVEAIRQIHSEQPDGQVMFIHTVLIPTIPGTCELKTKPAQHSWKQLMSYGIQPDVFILRASEDITDEIRQKLSLFCDLPTEAIVESKTVKLIYEVPLVFNEQGLDRYVLDFFHETPHKDDTQLWREMCEKFKNAEKHITVALVGKYMKLHDSYLSVTEALLDAGYNSNTKTTIEYIDSEELCANNVEEILGHVDGILIPGGFGERGVEGMITAVQFARERDIPFFGICMGLQVSVIEAAKNQLGWADANSTEFDRQTPHPVIDLMLEQRGVTNLGGTQRLGNWDCHVYKDSRALTLYGRQDIVERHRHRYEFNNRFRKEIESTGIKVSGKNLANELVEIIERPDHRYFLACQFHPEFKSRPNRPHPLFRGFAEACIDYSEAEKH